MDTPINQVGFSVVDKIIEELLIGLSVEQISTRYPWLSLSETDRRFLIQQVRGGNERSKLVLRLLAHMVQDLPEPFRLDQIEVLFLGYIYLNWNETQKQLALSRIEQALDEFRSFVEQEPRFLLSYQEYTARFHFLRGKFHLQRREYDKTISEWSQASYWYRQANFLDKASRLEYLVEALSSPPNYGPPFSEGVIDDWLWGFLSDENQRLLNHVMEQKAKLEQLEAEVESKQQELNILNQKVQYFQDRLEILSRQIQEDSIYLEFLKTLRQSSPAPLWLEIVRLALQQGELDDLAAKAIKRLLQFPEQWDADLLDQVIARAGEYWGEDWIDLNSWANKLHEIGELDPSDSLAIAKMVVEAWEALLKLPGYGKSENRPGDTNEGEVI